MIKTNVELSNRQKKQLLRGFLLSFVLIIGLFLPPYNEFVNRFEQTLYDFRLRSLYKKQTSDNIVIVDIDTASINKLSLWPWPRNYWALAITHLNQYNPRVIGVDVLFDTHSPNNENDTLLANTLSQHDNVVLASRRHTEKKAAYEIKIWSKPIDMFAKSTPHGFVNVPVDQDGIVRKSFYSLSSHTNEIKYSFDHAIYNVFNKHRLNHKLSIPASSIIHRKSTDKQYFVNYMVHSDFKRIPFHLVLENRISDPAWIKDKIILIGASDPALNDLFFTPLGQIPAVDIHAHSISTFLSKRFITPFNHLLNSILICALLFLTVTAVILFSGYISFLSMLCILISYLSVSYFMFSKYLILMSWAPFILAMILGYASTLIIKLISEEQQRKYIRSVFSQYVSPEVVKTLINSPEALALGGQRKTVSIFFSDIRSFTSLSEQYPAEQIVSQLNEYLDVMTRSVFKWKGTLDKYVGDEIMAIWGAPIEDNQHALNAVMCGWEHLTLLKTLQQKWKNENLPLFDIGIGINSGEVVVGNIGSSIQKDYTVIGDEVNYAARLEGLTRQFSDNNHICRFIISESTYNQVKEYCKVKSLGDIPVKGKEKSYPIFEVLDVTIPDKENK